MKHTAQLALATVIFGALSMVMLFKRVPVEVVWIALIIVEFAGVTVLLALTVDLILRKGER